jgi:hypothetical protein
VKRARVDAKRRGEATALAKSIEKLARHGGAGILGVSEEAQERDDAARRSTEALDVAGEAALSGFESALANRRFLGPRLLGVCGKRID